MNADRALKLISDIAKQYLIDQPYIVGGLPRDIYLGNKIKTADIDITTNSPDVLRLGILTAKLMKAAFEISDDGRLTIFTDTLDLDFSSHFISEHAVNFLPEKDKKYAEVFSRDFTMNTLLMDLDTRKIYDPTEMGFDDINNKILRTPIKAEYTLMDDPKRGFRAISLAARYDLKIHEDIKKFILENNDVFSPKNVSDKYVIGKISKALSENAEKTLSLLMELDLFKFVPLTGYFKDLVIHKKLLKDYLEASS